MVQLTMGGEELPLTLTLDYDADGIEEAQTTFTAELTVWNGVRRWMVGEDEKHRLMIH